MSRAEKTIGLCHLERRRLRDARVKLMEKVVKAVECHELAVSQNNELMLQMTRELVELFTAAESPFAGAARFVDHNRRALYCCADDMNRDTLLLGNRRDASRSLPTGCPPARCGR